MTAAKKWDLLSEDEYLRGELVSGSKHEYVGGVIYAMAGAQNRHNAIALNGLASLHERLRGKPCQPWNSDTKVRIQLKEGTRYYYPDAMVVCRPNPEGDSYQDEPTIVFEVLSESSRRIDEGEKRDAYLAIPSLAVYALVEPDEPVVRIWRRAEDGFRRVVVQGLGASVPLPEIGIELPLADLYRSIEFEG